MDGHGDLAHGREVGGEVEDGARPLVDYVASHELVLARLAGVPVRIRVSSGINIQ